MRFPDPASVAGSGFPVSGRRLVLANHTGDGPFGQLARDPSLAGSIYAAGNLAFTYGIGGTVAQIYLTGADALISIWADKASNTSYASMN